MPRQTGVNFIGISSRGGNEKTRLKDVFKSGAGGSIYPALFQFVIMAGHLVKNVIIYMIYTVLNHNESSISVVMQIYKELALINDINNFIS